MLTEDLKVSSAALAVLGGPEVLDFFVRLGPALDSFVRLGQVAVATVTVLYISRKFNNARRCKPEKDSDESI